MQKDRILDMKEFSYKHNMQGAEEIAHPELMEMEDDDYVYRLAGVNIHTGTASGGHYYSLINTKRGSLEPEATKSEELYEEWTKTKDDPWKTFNDGNLSTFAFSNMEKEAFGAET